MAYFCQRELDFTLALLARMRIPAHKMPMDGSLAACDGGLRKLLGMEEDYERAGGMAAKWLQERTVYRMVDQFLCRYVYCRLPKTEPAMVLVLGPYLTADLSTGDLMELAEQLRIPVSNLPHLANCYASLPVFPDPAVILAVVYTLGEALWGGNDFDTVDVDAEQRSRLPSGVSVSAPIEQEHILQQMQQMEERYAYEDKLMEIVSKGLTNQAETLLSSISQLNFQPRIPDPLRNQKNYCIICNTLLRKATQQGGVHPFHIDKMSSQFARAIENASTLEKCSALIGEMVTAYCRLVHAQTREQYSPAIQKLMSYIDANLSGDLSLVTLAHLIKVSPSYLSNLFHRETGHTLAEHIAQSRMQAALQLLKTTSLQIQTVAQLCGFNDPNYFGKQFKRHYGITPQQYRRGQAGYYPPGRD
ncbi:MAG: helix-turn-helix domain-containing protein [Clostridiales bacterium]|nr:helix-turn-helix domain-containing protein [Clostridiales bacterium]